MGLLTIQALAVTFVITRAHAGSRRQMLGRGEACHVDVDFSEQNLNCALPHPWNRVQESHRLLLHQQVLVDGSTATLVCPIQVVPLVGIFSRQEAMVE